MRISMNLKIPDPEFACSEVAGHWEFGTINRQEIVIVLLTVVGRMTTVNRYKSLPSVLLTSSVFVGPRSLIMSGARKASHLAVQNAKLWEVSIRSRNDIAHRNVGSLHAVDATLEHVSAEQNGRFPTESRDSRGAAYA
jgi:hypothetical protein